MPIVNEWPSPFPPPDPSGRTFLKWVPPPRHPASIVVGVLLLVATGLIWAGTVLPYRYSQSGTPHSGWDYVSGADYARPFYAPLVCFIGLAIVGLAVLDLILKRYNGYKQSLIVSLIASVLCLVVVLLTVADVRAASDTVTRNGGHLGVGPAVVIAGGLLGMSVVVVARAPGTRRTEADGSTAGDC
jgi:hypothetical protein